jgi:alpha-1,3-mannosyltransferase
MEAMVDGLSAAQRAVGHDVRIVTLGAGRWVTAAGVPVVGLRRVGPRRWPFAVGLRAALAGAEVVHVHGIDGLADQALTLRPDGAAVGISTHGGYLHTRRDWAVKQAWLRTGTRWSLRRADAIWFTSDADRRALAPAGLRGEVVPDGVALGRSRVVRALRAPVAGRLIALGRVDVHKGIDRLLRALAEPAAARLEVDVVGPCASEALRGELGALAERLGVAARVRFRGALPAAAIDALLACAEAAVFPSRAEGFGLALVEAMAAGVPCVVQPIPAFVEKVRDGVDGLVVDFDEAASAARVLATLGDRDLAALGAAGAEAAEAWSWERVLPAWERAYAAIRGRA